MVSTAAPPDLLGLTGPLSTTYGRRSGRRHIILDNSLTSNYLVAVKTDHVVALIANIHEAAHSLILRELARNGVHDLAPSHGAILDELYRQSPLRMNELAKKIRRDKSTVTALVNKLVQLGYVKKRPTNLDRRATEVTLTAKSRNLQPVFEKVSQVLLDRVYSGFTTARAEQMITELEEVLVNFKAHSRRTLQTSAEITDTPRRLP